MLASTTPFFSLEDSLELNGDYNFKRTSLIYSVRNITVFLNTPKYLSKNLKSLDFFLPIYVYVDLKCFY